MSIRRHVLCRPESFKCQVQSLAWLLATSLMLLAATVARGQEFDLDGFDLGGFSGGPSTGKPVQIEAQFTPATDDRPAVLMVSAFIDKGYHIYSLTQEMPGPKPTTIRLNKSSDYKPIGDWRAFPEPHTHVERELQAWKGQTIEEHTDEVTWYLPIEVNEGVDVGSLTIGGTVNLQACREGCELYNLDFEARRGAGVPIGPIETSESGNVATQSGEPAVDDSTIVPQPPSEAGVFRADDSVVTWYGWLEQSTVEPGGRTYLYLRAELPESWHLNTYAKQVGDGPNRPTLIVVQPSEYLVAYLPEMFGEVTEQEAPLPEFGNLRYHENEVAWRVPIDVDADLEPGTYELRGAIGYQACEANENGLGSCEVSRAAEFNVKLNVRETAGGPPAAVTFTPAQYNLVTTQAKEIANQLQAAPSAGRPTIIEFTSSQAQSNLGLAGMLGAALVGGLILNLMPCVLPVIGLKIMAFAKQGGESRARVFTLNLTYVAGLMAVFMLLATLAALPQLGLGTNAYEWGELNTQTWFKVSLTALVFVMALSFLGVWEIPLPGFAGSSAAAELASREGYGGAFFKGVLTTILATPCSGPFLGPVFGYTISQPASTTYLIFFCVGLGMSLPYLLIGAFPELIRWIPKPGAWMDTFKQLMAFVLLGTVVYLLSTINTEKVIATLALLVALWFACWLGGRQPITAPLARRSVAWMLGLTTAIGVGMVGFAPEREGALAWKDFSPAQLVAAKEKGKTVLVDFTADWCLTCQWNLATAIDVAAVKDVVEANKVEALKADWTDEDPAIEEALAQLESRSIPLLAIYPADRPDEVIVLRDTVSKTDVLQALAAAGAGEKNPHRGFVLSRPGGEEQKVSDNSALATRR